MRNYQASAGASADNLHDMSDHLLICEAKSHFLGQISRTPDAEIALVLLDRLEYVMHERDAALHAREDNHEL